MHARAATDEEVSLSYTKLRGSFLAALVASGLSGCVTTDEAVFGNSASAFQPIKPGYGQSCAVHKLQVSDCNVFRIEQMGPTTAMLWFPGEGKPSTLAYERIDTTTFIAQLSMNKEFAYVLGRRSAEGRLTITPPDCKILTAEKQRLASAGIELAPSSTSARCRPSRTDAKALKSFFEVVAATHAAATQPTFHLRELSEAEGRRMFDEQAAKKKGG